MKELVEVRAKLGTLRSDFSGMRQTVDALTAQTFVGRDQGS